MTWFDREIGMMYGDPHKIYFAHTTVAGTSVECIELTLSELDDDLNGEYACTRLYLEDLIKMREIIDKCIEVMK